MSADYPAAQEHFVPRNFMFNSNAAKAIVIHKTGGDATPQSVYNTFLASGNPGNSVHYAVGTDGTIWQFVPENLGAGGNGATEPGYDPFWTPYVNEYGNLNLCTFSIEHCDASLDNSIPVTPAQKAASFALVLHLCRKYNIPASHIKTHASIDPVNRARCPGNYPMSELISFIQQGGTSVQPYTRDSADFGQWFTYQDDNHWLCKQTNVQIHDAILHFYQRLSLDGNTLPVIGLPLTGEIYLTIDGHKVTLVVCERAAIYYDPVHAKDHQPGTGDLSLCHLTDPDLLKNIPGLNLPTAPTPVDTTALVAAINAIPDGIAPLVAAALVEAKKL